MIRIGANHTAIVPLPKGGLLAHDAQIGVGGFAQLLRVVGAVAGTCVSAIHQLLGNAMVVLNCRADRKQTGDLGKHGIHIKTHRSRWKVAIPIE